MTTDEQNTPAFTTHPLQLGVVWLPSGAGTPVGRFEFLVFGQGSQKVQIGTPVAADTLEGAIIGVVTDMRTVGQLTDPTRGTYDAYADPLLMERAEAMVATVQVFHSNALRPIRAGLVRPATPEEMLRALGSDKMDWKIPAGCIRLADDRLAPVHLSGTYLLGPEAAHMTIFGLSGMAAKTSYAGVLLRSAIHAGSAQSESTAALVFNVKGDDLLFLDQPPAPGYELEQADKDKYAAMDVPAEPFPDVVVWAPALPGESSGTRSSRADAEVLRWDLRSVWPYLRYVYPWIVENDNMQNFLSDFEEEFLRSANPNKRIDTFAKLEEWFSDRLRDADEQNTQYAYRSHHVATVRRAAKNLLALPGRFGGLLSRGPVRSHEDIPAEAWHHGQVVVVDISGLDTVVQSVVIARTTERLLASAERGSLGVDHLVLFMDELNAFAPSSGSEMSSVRRILQRVSTQGRYAGISLWGAGQQASRVDDLILSNAATRALGVTTDAELSSGSYGRLSSGLSERLATLPKGQMALWHHAFRNAVVVEFPRPAWRTGQAKPLASRSLGRSDTSDSPYQDRRSAADTLPVSQESLARLTEGIPKDVVEQIVATADDPNIAVQALAAARIPDMHASHLVAPRTVDPENPFALD